MKNEETEGENMKGYPIERKLDGVYFRVCRNSNWVNVCFSDLTEEERNDVMKDRSTEWLKSLCNILADDIRYIGEQFNIMGDYPEG